MRAFFRRFRSAWLMTRRATLVYHVVADAHCALRVSDLLGPVVLGKGDALAVYIVHGE